MSVISRQQFAAQAQAQVINAIRASMRQREATARPGTQEARDARRSRLVADTRWAQLVHPYGEAG